MADVDRARRDVQPTAGESAAPRRIVALAGRRAALIKGAALNCVPYTPLIVGMTAAAAAVDKDGTITETKMPQRDGRGAVSNSQKKRRVMLVLPIPAMNHSSCDSIGIIIGELQPRCRLVGNGARGRGGSDENVTRALACINCNLSSRHNMRATLQLQDEGHAGAVTRRAACNC